MTESNKSNNDSWGGPNLRKVIGISAGIAALLGGIKLATNEKVQEAFMVEMDPEAAKAIKIREIFAKIEKAKETLSILVGKSNVSKEDVIRNPGEIIETLQSASRSVQEINLALVEIEETGFKVNSVVAYKQVRDIEEKIANLSGGGFFSDFARIGGDYVPNIDIPLTSISLSPQQISRAISERDKLVKDLKLMKTLLGNISEPGIEEFSNNKYVNESTLFEPPKHRLDFIQIYMFKVLRKDIERKEGKDYVAEVGGDELSWYRSFLEEFGFAKYPDGDWYYDDKFMNRVKIIDKQGKESYKAMMRVALKARDTYDETGRVTSSSQIKKLQDMLARGGYFDYRHFDTSYGKETHQAFTAYLQDTTPDDIDELVGLQ